MVHRWLSRRWELSVLGRRGSPATQHRYSSAGSLASSLSASSFFSPLSTMQPSRFQKYAAVGAGGGGGIPATFDSTALPTRAPVRTVPPRAGSTDPASAAFLADEASSPNPYSRVRIYRNEETFPLSIDVPFRKVRDAFLDDNTRRCKLCGETYTGYASIHQSYVPHQAREAIAMEFLRAHCGKPQDVLAMWWHRLDTSTHFQRIRSLSSSDPHERRRRLIYLLFFLRDRNILRECFNVHTEAAAGSAGRSWSFERLEWVGDNVVKYIFNERLTVVFPLQEGGIKGRLGFAQNMIDGNDGLARAYDYFRMEALTASDRVVSKFKADVVEALFGELQVYLWSTEVDYGADAFLVPLGPEFVPIRALVQHTMEELAHGMLMFHLESIVGSVQGVVSGLNASYVRADPGQRATSAARFEAAADMRARRAFTMVPLAEPLARPPVASAGTAPSASGGGGRQAAPVALPPSLRHRAVRPAGGFARRPRLWESCAALAWPEAHDPQRQHQPQCSNAANRLLTSHLPFLHDFSNGAAGVAAAAARTLPAVAAALTPTSQSRTTATTTTTEAVQPAPCARPVSAKAAAAAFAASLLPPLPASAQRPPSAAMFAAWRGRLQGLEPGELRMEASPLPPRRRLTPSDVSVLAAVALGPDAPLSLSVHARPPPVAHPALLPSPRPLPPATAALTNTPVECFSRVVEATDSAVPYAQRRLCAAAFGAEGVGRGGFERAPWEWWVAGTECAVDVVPWVADAASGAGADGRSVATLPLARVPSPKSDVPSLPTDVAIPWR